MNRKRSVAYGLRVAVPALLLPMLLICTASQGGEKKLQQDRQGAKTMVTYPVGRFAIDVPYEMNLDHQGQRFRYALVEEFLWPADVPRQQARDAQWEKQLRKIAKLEPPKGKDRVVVESREFPGIGAWCRGILYRGNRLSQTDGRWLLLVDAGAVGIVLELEGLIQYEKDMLQDLLEIARSYHVRRFGDIKLTAGNWFYTRHGALNLPYLEQESATVRFAGHPLELKIEVETTEVHQTEKREHGLIARTFAAIASGYAVGVDVDRIRSRDRTIAGLEGEEEIDRMKAQDERELSFAWRYAGRKDSGNYPQILITMESEDCKLDEKLKLWDAVLNSMKPLYK